MNVKLLTDEALREDLYCELMITAGSMMVYGIKGGEIRDIIERQLDYLMPVIKRHIKRHVRAHKESAALNLNKG